MSVIGIITVVIFVLYWLKFGLGRGLKFLFAKALKSFFVGGIIAVVTFLCTWDWQVTQIAYAVATSTVTAWYFYKATQELK